MYYGVTLIEILEKVLLPGIFLFNRFLAQGAFGSVVWQTVPSYKYIRVHVFEMAKGYFMLFFYLLATIALGIVANTQSINRGDTNGAIWFITIIK